jgi:hypothetical protein
LNPPNRQDDNGNRVEIIEYYKQQHKQEMEEKCIERNSKSTRYSNANQNDDDDGIDFDAILADMTQLN